MDFTVRAFLCINRNMKELQKDEQLMTALSTVVDPELHLPITEMGLIYGARLLKDGTAKITMTLTTIGCPLIDVIQDDITKALTDISAVKEVDIELTFDPPWSPDMMSEEARIEVGLPV